MVVEMVYLVLKATPQEVRAMSEMIGLYVAYLEASILRTPEQQVAIRVLRALEVRMKPLQDEAAAFVTIRLSLEEAMAFGQAVIVYQKLLRSRPTLLPKTAYETLLLVRTMQQRFLDHRAYEGG